jgi:hypothetical protein
MSRIGRAEGFSDRNEQRPMSMGPKHRCHAKLLWCLAADGVSGVFSYLHVAAGGSHSRALRWCTKPGSTDELGGLSVP